MSSFRNLVLCFSVFFCVMQVISARPHNDGMLWENVKFDLEKKCAAVEKDMEKEMKNVVNKLTKEAAKLNKKAVKKESQECLENARLQAEEELEDKSQEARECVVDLQNEIESSVSPDASVSEILSFRQIIKNKLQLCKKKGKMNIKTVQNQFAIAGKECLV